MNDFKDKKVLNAKRQEELKFGNKRVLIFGLGINQGGVGAARFFAKRGAQVKVTDLKSSSDLAVSLKQLKDFPQITYRLGEHSYKDLDWADLIIKNPAVKPGNKYINYAEEKGKQLETDMGIFLQLTTAKQIIGITGTKGKSTTASLIYEVLKNSDKKVVFAGNIGKSVLDTVESTDVNSLIILELSSFQLEGFSTHQISPHWAVITNIFQDHLNYYQTFDDYVAAKKVICQYQTAQDFLFIRRKDPITATRGFLNKIKSQIIYFSKNDLPKNFAPKLQGEHNLENMAVAFKLGKLFNIPDQVILKSLTNFEGVEFRLQLVKEWRGIKIYNDTTATNPSAAIQAIKSFPNCILIAGGQNANLDFTDFAKAIKTYTKQVYFLKGDATEEIKKQFKLDNLQLTKIKGEYDDLEKLLMDIKQKAKPGDVILFSPGAKSFNMFRNEFDRGRKFNQQVEKIFN